MPGGIFFFLLKKILINLKKKSFWMCVVFYYNTGPIIVFLTSMHSVRFFSVDLQFGSVNSFFCPNHTGTKKSTEVPKKF